MKLLDSYQIMQSTESDFVHIMYTQVLVNSMVGHNQCCSITQVVPTADMLQDLVIHSKEKHAVRHI